MPLQHLAHPITHLHPQTHLYAHVCSDERILDRLAIWQFRADTVGHLLIDWPGCLVVVRLFFDALVSHLSID